MEPITSWFLVGFISTAPQWELPSPVLLIVLPFTIKRVSVLIVNFMVTQKRAVAEGMFGENIRSTSMRGEYL